MNIVIKKVYVYLVLFATLMMTIGGSVSVFVSIANLVAPNTYVLSYEDYVQTYHTEYDTKGNIKHGSTKDVDTYKEHYDNYIKQEEDLEKKRSLNQLIASFGWIIIPLPVFLFMQRSLREEEKEPKKETPEEGK